MQVQGLQTLQRLATAAPGAATAGAGHVFAAAPAAATAPASLAQTAQAFTNMAKSPVGAATRKATIWGIAAAGIALFSLTHPLTWPIAAVAGYFSFKNFRAAKALKALV